MTQADLPPPPVPPEVDLRGLEYMPLLGAKLFASDFALAATDAEFRTALKLWWEAWNQTPAASLPNVERAQAKLAGFEDERSSSWRRVRGRALYGFSLHADGRLYHPVLATQALIAWEKRVEHQAERENSNERKRRDRAERASMFEALRSRGVVLPFDTKKDVLRRTYDAHFPPPVTLPVTVTGHATGDAPVTVTDTAKTGRDGTVIQGAPATGAAAPPGQGLEAPLCAHPGWAQGRAGDVGRAVEAAGLAPGSVNLADPVLATLLAQGAEPVEFAGLVGEALRKGVAHPWPWVLAALVGRRADAAGIALAPPTASAPTVPSDAAAQTQAYLAAQQLSPDEQAAAAEARAVAMQRLGRRSAGAGHAA